MALFRIIREGSVCDWKQNTDKNIWNQRRRVTRKSRKLEPTKAVCLDSAVRALLNVLENDVMDGAVRTYPRIKKHIPFNNVQLWEEFSVCLPLSVIVYSCFSLLLCVNHWKFGTLCITFHKIFRNAETLWYSILKTIFWIIQ